MRLLQLSALLLLPAAAWAAAPTPRSDFKPLRPCNVQARMTQGDDPPRARRLDELPPGDLQLAVVREMEGCMKPVIIRQNVGARAPVEAPRR